MKIKEIAYKLNEKSSKYKIGELQETRKAIKNFAKKASQTIFDDRSIFDNWAFHYGGRKEIQFNIGFEDGGLQLRFGLAFSLETSQYFNDLRILFPKIYRLNCLIREKPEQFKPYQMWHFQKEERSSITEVREIKPNWVKEQAFIFFGKIVKVSEIKFDDILATFDDLLEIYLEVENEKSESQLEIMEETKLSCFKFSKKERKLIENREYNTIEKAINIDIRHSILQQKLIDELALEYGEENISCENPINGKK